MAGYQNIHIIGNVGRDPELKYTGEGVAVCEFSVAVNDYQDRVTWFKVSAWRQLAETCNTYVVKGMQLMVAGRVSVSAYIAQDGEARASLELTARDVQFFGQRGEGGDGDRANAAGEDLPF